MATNENIQAWSTTAATNANADTGINWAEGQDAATVNNSARSMMAATAKYIDDTDGALVAAGTANALTVTTNQVLSSGHLAAGLRLAVRATADNTATAVTFAPDGLTAGNIKRADGSALAVGSIKSGMMLDLVYNAGSSEWRAVNVTPVNVPGNPGMILLASGAIVANAAIDLSGYGYYRGYKFYLAGVTHTGTSDLGMRLSHDGGANFHLAAGDYTYALQSTGSAATYYNAVSSIIILANQVQTDARWGFTGEVTLFPGNLAEFPRTYHIGSYVEPGTLQKTATGSATANGLYIANAVAFYPIGNSFGAGTYSVYGLA